MGSYIDFYNWPSFERLRPEAYDLRHSCPKLFTYHIEHKAQKPFATIFDIRVTKTAISCLPDLRMQLGTQIGKTIASLA